MENLIQVPLFEAEAVASTGAKTTASIDTRAMARIESIAIRAASASGTADVKVEYQTSQDDEKWDSAADNPDIIPTGSNTGTADEFPNNVEGWNHATMVTHLSRYIRFVVTGVGSNPADTLVDMKAMCREVIG